MDIREIETLIHKTIKALYLAKDINFLENNLADDINWVGAGEAQYIHNKKMLINYWKTIVPNIPECKIEREEFITTVISDDCYIVLAKYWIYPKDSEGIAPAIYQKTTFVVSVSDNIPYVRHIHFSSPYEELFDDKNAFEKIDISTYKNINRLLTEKAELIDIISNSINCGVKVSDDDETYSFYYISDSLPKMLGYDYDEFIEVTRSSMIGLIYEADLSKALQDLKDCFSKGMKFSIEYRIRKKDGSLVWVRESGQKSKDYAGKLKLSSIIVDITEYKDMLHSLNVEHELYQIAVENSFVQVFEYNVLKDRFTMYQYSDKGNVKTDKERFVDLLRNSSYIYSEDVDNFIEALQGDDNIAVNFRAKKDLKYESWAWYELKHKTIFNNGIISRVVGTLRDVTEEKENLQSLVFRATRDSLTHILNTGEAKKQIINILDRHETMFCAMMIIDLDNFKRVNDTLGHSAGNDVLIAVANILKDNFRSGDIVSRIGGDEFMVFVYIDNKDYDFIKSRARDILNNINKIKLDDGWYVSVSIGISVFYGDYVTYNHLFEEADECLYNAKRKGKNQYYIKDFEE